MVGSPNLNVEIVYVEFVSNLNLTNLVFWNTAR
jgi:hypothetical protein